MNTTHLYWSAYIHLKAFNGTEKNKHLGVYHLFITFNGKCIHKTTRDEFPVSKKRVIIFQLTLDSLKTKTSVNWWELLPLETYFINGYSQNRKWFLSNLSNKFRIRLIRSSCEKVKAMAY